MGDRTWPETVMVDDLSGIKILSPLSSSKSFSGDLSKISRSNSVTTRPMGSISSKLDISLDMEVRAKVGSPPTEEILPLEIAVAIDSSN